MERVRSVLPSAFLAGGALRDLDNGRPVKDYDVFFTEDYDFNSGKLDMAIRDSFYGYRKACSGEYMDAAKEVMGTYTFISFVGQPELNLVKLDKHFNPAAIIDRMDFGLCQIGADMLGVTSTPAYEFDKRNQCFTLTRAESVDGVWRSLMRYERLSQKYQGWALNVPEEFKALVEAAEDAHNATTLEVALRETF